MNLAELNNISAEAATQAFMRCCTSGAWVAKMVASRPYVDTNALFEAANSHWAGLAERDYLEAFDGHPKIGDVSSLRTKYANSQALAASELAAEEQSGMNVADDQTINQFSRANADYEAKFGFIFIVCATGKSASEMLALLNGRLGNSRQDELNNAAEEQRKIFHIRLHQFD